MADDKVPVLRPAGGGAMSEPVDIGAELRVLDGGLWRMDAEGGKGQRNHEFLLAGRESIARITGEVARLTAELAAANERAQRAEDTVKRLNRRCQEAESGLAVKVEEIERKGGSLGRALASSAAAWRRHRIEALEAELARSQKRERALSSAMAGLLAHEVYTFEGNLEARITVPQDAVDAARAALDSPPADNATTHESAASRLLLPPREEEG